MTADIPIFIVDAFTSEPFGGNPAAVCLLKEDIPDQTKQQIAMEMNLSETAFVVSLAKQPADNDFTVSKRFSLRWFTPTTEVPLCGHATLASATILFYMKGNEQELEFTTIHSGVLTARRTEDKGVEMQLPINPPNINLDVDDTSSIWKLVRAVLQDSPLAPKHVRLSPTTKKLLVRLGDQFTRNQLESLTPKLDVLMAINTSNRVRGIIVTMSGQGTKYDFLSRYFAPWVGIPEDPVTGSAHTVLAHYWSEQLNGKSKLFARQCSPRGGELGLELKHGTGQVTIKGKGTVVLAGNFMK